MPDASVKFCFRLSRFAIALLLVFAPLFLSVRSALSIAAPNEQGKVSPKVVYILINPDTFRRGADRILLVQFRKAFDDDFKDPARLRSPLDGAKYDTCDPKEVCDRIEIIWYEQRITTSITCKTKQSRTNTWASPEPHDEKDFGVILERVLREVQIHNVSHNTP